MLYLLDTYNLMHAAIGMGGPLADMTVRKLCQYLAASPSSINATLVLDGRPKPDEPSENEFPDFTLIYSGTGVKADTVIAQKVERSRIRKKLTVVSNDRAVALHARRHFAHAMSCEEFLRFITEVDHSSSAALPPKKVGGGQTPGESEHWMKEFGLDSPKKPAIEPNRTPKQRQPRTEDDLGGLNVEDLLGPPGDL